MRKNPPPIALTSWKKKLEQSLKQIEQMRKEITDLRGANPPPAAAAPSNASAVDSTARETIKQQAAKIEDLERQVGQVSDANAFRGLKAGIPLHGFADVGATFSRQSNIYQNGPKGFNVGAFSLYLTPELSARVKSLVELSFEVSSQGDVSTDLERLQLGYTFSDALTMWAGRYHTPYGYWNTAYHHGQQIQTTLTRPRFLEFEDRGGILPAHTVGLWFTGGRSGGRYEDQLRSLHRQQPARVGRFHGPRAGRYAQSQLVGFDESFHDVGRTHRG